MKLTVIIHAEAEHDFIEAVEWYEAQQQGLGYRLIEDWEQIINYISEYPEAYQIKKKNYRDALLKIFPYTIVYEIIQNKIVVFSFKHLKQNPKKRYKTRKS